MMNIKYEQLWDKKRQDIDIQTNFFFNYDSSFYKKNLVAKNFR